MISKPVLKVSQHDTPVPQTTPLVLTSKVSSGRIKTRLIWLLGVGSVAILILLATIFQFSLGLFTSSSPEMVKNNLSFAPFEDNLPHPAQEVQFSLHKNVTADFLIPPAAQATLKDCQLPAETDQLTLQAEISQSRSLFFLPPEPLFSIVEGGCGLALIETSAVDASLDSHRFHLFGQLGEQEVIFSAPLYQFNVTDQMDQFLFDLGYTTEGDSVICDQDCSEREVAYLENTSYDEPHVQSVIAEYQTIFRASF